ncbi:DEAD/DEAH box helicase [Cellvibrio sp. NN19]|uniref:DEAD/DEAH box helicase n=1 Tax=Cellvibrio chitinivorans TaxID=3102792 RepID=UPI002B404FAE|nr:DEAD/DEAH box helicase [Cellvibrio sp. NN19]
MNFASLGLAPELLRAVKTIGYKTLTPVQEQAIPTARRGIDLLTTAQTGTGKTAAYSLPVLQQMLEKPRGTEAGFVRTLILAPTRELVEQIAKALQEFAQFTPFKIASIYGGVKVTSQGAKLRAGVDILVATPGRLKEHVELENVSLAKVDFVVLDEADRMLDMGFVVDIHAILTSIPRKHQTLFFSATGSPLVTNLSKQAMNRPTLITVTKRNSVAETVDHVLHPVDSDRKYELFIHLLREQNWYQVMVFSSTREEAENLVKALKFDKVDAAVIHSEKTQGARRRALQEFKEGKLQVLVATEVAARGLDIQGLDYVVNLDLPFYTEDYVHRVGRTGRAGKKGVAISLVTPAEEHKISLIEDVIGTKIKREKVKGFEVTEQVVKVVSKPKSGLLKLAEKKPAKKSKAGDPKKSAFAKPAGKASKPKRADSKDARPASTLGRSTRPKKK